MSRRILCAIQQKEVLMPRRKYEIINTRTGELIDDDDDVLRDGQTLRVPLYMRDGMSDIQREVADAKAMRDAAKRFGLHDASALHRPGPRFLTDQAARARVEQARAEGIKDMCDAWRTPTTNSAVRGQQPGDQCTINGAPGHLNHH
jgi:hypothetical protein